MDTAFSESPLEPRKNSNWIWSTVKPALWTGVLLLLLFYGMLALLDYFRYFENSKRDQAKRGVMILEVAIKEHFDKQGQYPATLDALLEVQGGRPWVEPRALIDPWGQSYRYDLNIRHPDTAVPRIWAVMPNGREIANWYPE